MQSPSDSPMEKIIHISTGFMASIVMYTVSKLGIVDIIARHGKAITAEQIAAELGSEYNPRPLFRMLRYFASLGLIKMHMAKSSEDVDYHKTYTFELNEISTLLLEDTPGSMRDLVIFLVNDINLKLWGGFGECIKQGQSAAKATLGAEIYDYLQQHPDDFQLFNKAMSGNTNREIGMILSAYDFSKFTSVVDIAGGTGTLLFSILKQHPHIHKGHLFELPAVIAKVVLPEELKDRVELHEGSFHDEQPTIPVGADLYILKHIIHNWQDDKAGKILRETKNAMRPHSRLVIVEYVIPSGNDYSFATTADLHMMVGAGAMERTAEEYRHLLRSAGFEMTQVLGQRLNLVEARPLGE